MQGRNIQKKRVAKKDLWQENYLGGQINSTTKNIREGWREIGKDEKINDQEE